MWQCVCLYMKLRNAMTIRPKQLDHGLIFRRSQFYGIVWTCIILFAHLATWAAHGETPRWHYRPMHREYLWNYCTSFNLTRWISTGLMSTGALFSCWLNVPSYRLSVALSVGWWVLSLPKRLVIDVQNVSVFVRLITICAHAQCNSIEHSLCTV